MSKRDDDSGDMDVGMTTAERRRRRRRGGGLRVPSDNVPRRTSPPVVAPVPEDPSLAMSIAYSFQPADSEVVREASAASEPVDGFGGEPIAPEAMSTMIDPPTPSGGSEDFEMKTREMSAVDLEALGLAGLDPSGGSAGDSNPSLPGVHAPPIEIRFKKPDPAVPPRTQPSVEVDSDEVEVEVTDDDDAAKAPPPKAEPVAAPAGKPARDRKERLKTVALSDEDLEEVREAVRAASVHEAPTAITQPIQPVVPQGPISAPIPVATTEPTVNRTQPLSALDLDQLRVETPTSTPVVTTAQLPVPSEEPMSVPDIDIQELSERASDTSGEYEVDVEEAEDDVKATAPTTQLPAVAAAGAPAATPAHPGAPPPTPHAPPPPPPAAAKAPPAPPPAAKKDKPAAPPPKETKRGKPWFVDLFDEDYLRTLPFLTPQATQSEAEFVIDAMQLAPGAQVIDIGCGYGRHAMELAARGFHVVGLDLSTPLLVRGGEEAMRRGLQINFVRGDIRELDFEAQFDGAYCLFSTFGYFDDETNKKAIGNIARALKPGGKVVIEILNRDYVIADLPTRVWWEGDGCVVLEEVELNYFSSRIQVNRSVVFDDGRQLEQEISVRAYSLHEVGKLMHAAGFRVLEVSGGYQTRGRFFGNQSRHIIVLAERKDSGT